MTRQILIWNPVICKNVRGEDYACSLPDLIAQKYRGRLAHEIQMMPRKNPLSFEQAINLIHEKCELAWKARDIPRYLWFHKNFVSHLSDCGYHIELTGDEFVVSLSPLEEI